jgi:hypothetical protein
MDVVSGELHANGAPASAEDVAILRCQRGDTAAFRSIYELHGTHLYRLAVLVTRDEDQAKDAVQETFMRENGPSGNEHWNVVVDVETERPIKMSVATGNGEWQQSAEFEFSYP